MPVEGDRSDALKIRSEIWTAERKRPPGNIVSEKGPVAGRTLAGGPIGGTQAGRKPGAGLHSEGQAIGMEWL